MTAESSPTPADPREAMWRTAYAAVKPSVQDYHGASPYVIAGVTIDALITAGLLSLPGTEGVASLRASGAPVDRDVLAVLDYVSRGRRYVDVTPYPDAAARRVLGRIYEARRARPEASAKAKPERPMPATSLEALRDLASGLTTTQIAARRDLTESAATMRLARAREYLGASTNPQAVYEATLRGLLRGVPRP